jgi:hypothetical protein
LNSLLWLAFFPSQSTTVNNDLLYYHVYKRTPLKPNSYLFRQFISACFINEVL